MAELTAAAPRFHWDARRVGAGVGAARRARARRLRERRLLSDRLDVGRAARARLRRGRPRARRGDPAERARARSRSEGSAGFGAWTWLAIVWSEDPAATVLEGLRVLMYVSVFTALLLVLRREGVPLLLAATLAAIFLASGYGLLTRLFPERLGCLRPRRRVPARRAADLLERGRPLRRDGRPPRARLRGPGGDRRRTRRGLGDAAGLPRHALLHVQPRSLDRRSSRARRGRRDRPAPPAAPAHRRSSSRIPSGLAVAPLLSPGGARRGSMPRSRRRLTRGIASPSTSCCWQSQPGSRGPASGSPNGA